MINKKRINTTWKRICIILCFIFCGISIYGLDIVIIPITYYEKQGSNFVQRNYERNITEDIAELLNKYHDIQIDKTPLRDRLAGATDSDARRVAEYYQTNDILYGSVKSDGNSFTAELKIYNLRREDYGLFFASDSINQYDRLIKTLYEHIMEWFNTERDKMDRLRDEIRDLKAELEAVRDGINGKPEKEELKTEFVLRLPVNAGYWSYVDQLWVEMVQGTVEARLGIELVPELQLPEKRNKERELSFGLQIGYRNGITNVKDDVMLHTIIINPVLGYHLNFYTKNWLCLGAGIFYERAFWEINDRDYEKTEIFQQSLTGYSIILDYSYRFNRRVALSIGANLNGYFVSDTSMVMRVYFGTVITLLGGKNEKLSGN